MIEVKVIEKVGIIYLNRPDKLNAINISMVNRIKTILNQWKNDSNIRLILFDSLIDKGFSAGGDLKEIYDTYLINENCKNKDGLFKIEYDLDKYINAYPKPIVSHWFGIVMGGGVGLTINSDLIICEPNITWAMPETGLGFVPDVGVGKYISKLPQGLGQYVGLCGASLSSHDLIKYGIADYCLIKENYNIFIEAIFKMSKLFKDEELIKNIKNEIEKFDVKEDNSKLETKMNKIGKYFSYSSMEEIYSNLKANLDDEFALKAYKNLSNKDLFILSLQFEKYFTGKELSYDQSIDLDLKIVRYAIKKNYIKEGIRAKMIDKDNNPNWPIKSFDQVSHLDIKNLLGIKKLYKER